MSACAISGAEVTDARRAIRTDGRRIRPAHLFEAKRPDQSKYPWDYYKLVATIPANEAFIPLEKSVYPLAKKS